MRFKGIPFTIGVQLRPRNVLKRILFVFLPKKDRRQSEAGCLHRMGQAYGTLL